MEEIRNEYALETKLREEAKIGDRWYVCSGYALGTKVSKITVTKVTKTQICFSDNTAIMKRTGSKVGAGKWNHESYYPATEAHTKEFEEQILAAKAKYVLQKEIDRVILINSTGSTAQRLALIKAIREVLPIEKQDGQPDSLRSDT